MRKTAQPKRAAKKKAPSKAAKKKPAVKKKAKTTRKAGGRPSLFKPEYVEEARRLAEVFGAIDEEIAKFLKVTERTINRWKLEHPEFAEALALGKAGPNQRVEKALYHRAIGYSHPEEQIYVAHGVVTRVKTTKHYPPETKAIDIFLKNRSKDWRYDPARPPLDDDVPAESVKVVVSVKDARRGGD
jgi:hypothetical protein